MKKIIVTGGAGFIGSNLVDVLSKRNVKITILDNLSTGFRKYLNINKNIKFIKCNLLNKNKLKNIIQYKNILLII